MKKYKVIAEYTNGWRLRAYSTNSLIKAALRMWLLERHRNGEYKLIIEGVF